MRENRQIKADLDSAYKTLLSLSSSYTARNSYLNNRSSDFEIAALNDYITSFLFAVDDVVKGYYSSDEQAELFDFIEEKKTEADDLLVAVFSAFPPVAQDQVTVQLSKIRDLHKEAVMKFEETVSMQDKSGFH